MHVTRELGRGFDAAWGVQAKDALCMQMLRCQPSHAGPPLLPKQPPTRALHKQQNGLQLLPVTTRRGGEQRQYAWDGSCIKPVNTGLLGDGYTTTGGARGGARFLVEEGRRSRSSGLSSAPA